MSPLVCLDAGFSRGFDCPFGWVEPGVHLRVESPEAVIETLSELESRCARGAYAVVALNFEAAHCLMTRPKHFQARHHSVPLLEAWLFQTPPQALTVGEAPANTPWPLWESPDRGAYAQAFTAIQEAIAEGVCYQVNHTFRMRGRMQASPWALYQQTGQTQPAHYGGFVDFGARQIVSRSPELFLAKRGQRLRAEPMKGTAARHADPHQDTVVLQTLLDDPKMQAENLMIVDLIRNDLSQVAVSGSVSVPALFSAQSLKSVHQVSSTVEAELAENQGLVSMLSALFPCGSVIGAPKAQALQLIQDLEADARGLYTGSLGLLEPSGDFTWSVAIRTLEVDGESVTLGLGSGLVADSDLESEWQECLLKGRFAGVGS